MKPFMADKRKMMELLPLPVFLATLLIIFSSPSIAILFTFGFIWNWTVSQQLIYVQENSRYKFSTVKLVKNIHQLCLKPFSNPKLKWMAKFISLLPATLFWGLITYSFGSDISWWTCFFGSLSFEIIEFIFNRVSVNDGPPAL